MSQPSYAPIADQDKIRPAYRLSAPREWRADRVGDLKSPEHPHGRDLGVPGPDQGFALLVAEELFAGRIRLSAGVSTKDALHGCAAVACARAGGFGRAPVAKDVELALLVFGFLGDPPEDLLEWRTALFQGAAHDYMELRHIVDSVRPETLRMTLAQVRERTGDWRSLVLAD